MRFPHSIFLLLTLPYWVFPATVSAEEPFPAVQWQTLSLAGKKVGQRKITRSFSPRQVITHEELEIVTRTPGMAPNRSRISMTYRETADGKPLRVEKRVKSDTANHRVVAEVSGNRLKITRTGETGGRQWLEIPEGFLLREGVRLALLKQTGGTRSLEFQDWSFSRQSFEPVRLQAEEVVDPSSVARWKIQRSRPDRDNGVSATWYADDNFYTLDEYASVGDDEFVIETCDQACAEADFTPLMHVYRHLVRSPYLITETALQGKIRYRINPEWPLIIPATFEQKVERSDDAWRVTVCQQCGDEAVPTAAELQQHLQPSYWLGSDTEALRSVVNGLGFTEQTSAAEKMTRITRWVTRNMNGDVRYSGYASATEALVTRSGDCTEHGLLVAALGRAAGVPTRLAIGVTYSNDTFFGRKYVFVPHTWPQAWIGDRWRSYDSALGDFTAGYLVLGLSDGDQAAFLQVMHQLHRLTIESAARLKEPREG